MATYATQQVTQFGFEQYLPVPLRALTPLLDKRQLVLDIENSSNYLNDFPVLEKLENFAELWAAFVAKVSAVVPTLSIADHAKFIVGWQTFQPNIELLAQAFTSSSDQIITIPRTVMQLWPLDFSFMGDTLTVYDRQLLQYFDLILSPSTANVWQDLLTQTELFFDHSIHNNIESLRKLRDVRGFTTVDTNSVQDTTSLDDPTTFSGNVVAASDIDVINLTAKLVGLNLRDELLSALGPQKVAALIPMLGNFYTINSSDDFIHLIEIVLSSQVLLTHLYTNNYINFKVYDEISVTSLLTLEQQDNVKWFKTTHINLFVEYGGVKHLAAKLTSPLGGAVFDVVKLFLPINLVLRKFGFYYVLDSAPSLCLTGALDQVKATYFVQGAPQASVLPNGLLQAYLFDDPQQLQDFLAGYKPPSMLTIFNNWGRFSGAAWYPPGTPPQGEALGWSYDDATKSIVSLVNSALPIGVISNDALDSFTLETTVSSNHNDDDGIGVVIACLPGDPFRILYVMRYCYTTNNWLLQVMSGGKVKTIVNKSNNLTKGVQNPDPNSGWKFTTGTRIKVERTNSLITACCSPFGSTTYAAATQFTFDLASSPDTIDFIGPSAYGYVAFSQVAAKFTDIAITGGNRNDVVYDLLTNDQYDYNPVTTKWEVTPNVVFATSAKHPSRYENPATHLIFSIDQYGRIRRR